MARHAKCAPFVGYVAFVLLLTTPCFARADGQAFFKPAAANAKVDLVYFGFIKDTNGRLIEKAFVEVKSKTLGMEFPFELDKVGHYRSPDIGAYYKSMGIPVDPAGLEIVVVMPGWKQVSPIRTRVPNKPRGVINVDFIMQKMM
jgi:hypothetical protein